MLDGGFRHFQLDSNMDSQLRYRPDIDGLRAIAVLSVVAFHAFPDSLTGGFVGVDVFFVISGDLITSILVQQHREAKFSFGGFYSRRARPPGSEILLW